MKIELTRKRVAVYLFMFQGLGRTVSAHVPFTSSEVLWMVWWTKAAESVLPAGGPHTAVAVVGRVTGKTEGFHSRPREEMQLWLTAEKVLHQLYVVSHLGRRS